MEQLTNFINSELGVKLVKLTITLFIILIILFFTKKAIPKYVKNTNSRYKARKFTNLIGFILIAFAVLIIFSQQLNGFTVFIGVAGAGIAFALQELIASMAGFIVIHTANFYNVGDRVMVGGIKGDVIDIGLLRTSLMEIGDWVDGDLYNGRMTRVANSFIFKEPVFNYSGDFPFLWDELKIPIKTDSDFEYAREVFLDILNEINSEYAKEAKSHWNKMTEKLMIEEAKVEPFISMQFDQNWITFILRYVVNYKSRRSTKDKISTRILKAIQNSNGRIEVASSAFEITEFPSQSMSRN